MLNIGIDTVDPEMADTVRSVNTSNHDPGRIRITDIVTFNVIIKVQCIFFQIANIFIELESMKKYSTKILKWTCISISEMDGKISSAKYRRTHIILFLKDVWTVDEVKDLRVWFVRSESLND